MLPGTIGSSGSLQVERSIPNGVKLGSIMKAISKMRAGTAVFASAVCAVAVLTFAAATNAQRTAESTAAAQAKAVSEGRNHSLYDATKEVSLEGTVASFTESAKQFPAGAHVIVQTGAGTVDVHLGDARALKLNNFSVTQGSSVRIIGQPVSTPQGTFFLARLIQQGTQVVAVRTPQGFPVASNAVLPSAKGSATLQAGAR